ncbi:MAG: C-terminal target protein, partial [Segetibacter sp.]|nr:C-terminal target protein [Segetibacter sp.]
ASVSFATPGKYVLSVYPNPVANTVRLSLKSNATDLVANIITAEGLFVLSARGDINHINRQINDRIPTLSKGVYILKIGNASESHVVKFSKQ